MGAKREDQREFEIRRRAARPHRPHGSVSASQRLSPSAVTSCTRAATYTTIDAERWQFGQHNR